MNTKLKGDIAEQAAILHALKQSFNVLVQIGDRLSYDMVFEKNGCFAKIQVKSAWFRFSQANYVVDNRRTKTNRRRMIRENYSVKDFDFALVYLEDKDLFYIFPSNIFVSYASEIHMIESEKRQRKPMSVIYRDAWELILQWAA